MAKAKATTSLDNRRTEKRKTKRTSIGKSKNSRPNNKAAQREKKKGSSVKKKVRK